MPSGDLLAFQRKFAFEHFSVDQGMSSCSVPCIYQDHIGYLWFGTYSGIDRFDGYSFKSYRHDPEDPTSLVNALVQTLSEDSAGNIWVGTEKGFDTLDRATGRFTHFLPHPPGPGTERSNSVLSIHEDRDGVVFIGTDDGLNIFDRSNGKFTCFRDDRADFGDLGHNSIRTICEDSGGSLWIGTGSGLNKFDKRSGKFIHYWHEFKRMDRWGNWTNAIYEDRAGILWLGGGAGLVGFDKRTGTFTQYPYDPKDQRSLSSFEVSSISGDNAGHLWVGTYRNGLNIFDKETKRFTHCVHEEKDPGSLSSDAIQSVVCDRSGTIWVSTINQGVNELDRPKPPFTKYLYENQKPNTFRPSIFEDQGGKMLVSTSKGWDEFDPETGTFIRLPLGEGTFLLGVDRTNNMWISAESGGLYLRDRLHHMISFHDSSGNEFRQIVNSLIESRDGRFWMGTVGGDFFAVDPAAHSVRLIEQTGNQVNVIYEDPFGLLWAGLWGRGLMCYDPSRNTSVRYTSNPNDSTSVSGNTIWAIQGEMTGRLWIATNAAVDMYDRGTQTFTHFTMKDGLPHNSALGILEDDHGELWISTLGGISKFVPKSKRFRNYDVSYGLASNDPGSGCKARNGEMYFNGQHGLTRFHPDSIHDNTYVPPIVVTTFRKFDESVPFGKEIRLPYTDNVISFEFVALSYVSPQGNKYAYKLEGFDKNWIYCGSRRSATYTNLDGGKYVFKVKGSNNDGVWNEEGVSIAVIITPPYWKTWWFTLILWSTIAASIGGTIRSIEKRKLRLKIDQLERERSLERERLRISQDMHDEVGAGLTEIGILSELAKKEIRSPDEGGNHVQRISETSREIIASISEIIWAINPKNDLLDDLVAYLRDYTARYLGMTAIKVRFDIPETIPDFHLSAEERRNIFLVMKESLHNIVKHSEATTVFIKVAFTQQRLEILVEDNGKGFSSENLSRFGNGLRNMEKRMNGIGGRFEIESQPGKGTRVVISAGL
jgi:signal transduction histidine kinase/ligand-binding sensor domain-containing protein